MKVCVISTVAQHRLGAKFHLRNLSWALEDFESKILIQTYKSYGLEFNDPRVSLVEVDADPAKFYFFWDHTSKEMEKFVDDVDFFLFMEQDILFTKKPILNPEIPIQINLHSQYLSVFDESRQLLYPRMWEGCTFVRSDIVRSALTSGVQFGSRKNIPRWILNSAYGYYTTNSALHLNFSSISDYVANSLFLDTMFEFGLYCFLERIPYDLKSQDLNYEYGDQVVHFRGCDMMVRDNPIVYENPEEMFKMASWNDVWARLCNGCSFLFLISGLYSKDKIVARMIRNKFKKSDKLLLIKLKMIKDTAFEWLSEEEIDRLNWAASILKGPVLL